MSYNYDREGQLQKYSGAPSEINKKEISKWKKFIDFLLPWFSKKWELGNEYLEARVEKEKREAEKIAAETQLLKIKAEKEMREIIDMVARKEKQSSQQANIDDISEEDLIGEIEALQDKIRLMYLKYHLKISITADENDNTINISNDKSIEK